MSGCVKLVGFNLNKLVLKYMRGPWLLTTTLHPYIGVVSLGNQSKAVIVAVVKAAQNQT